MLEDLGREGYTDFPSRHAKRHGPKSRRKTLQRMEARQLKRGGEAEPRGQAARRKVREDSGKGEEPTRVQDPQARDTPGVEQESGSKKDPDAPETGRSGRRAPRIGRTIPEPDGEMLECAPTSVIARESNA